MTLLGKRSQANMVGAGQFHCSFCKRLSLYSLLDVQHRFCILGMSLWRTGNPERLILCSACQGVLPAEVLQATDSYPIDWPPGSHLLDKPHPRLRGERVLALWPFEPFWYPACVQKRDGDRVFIMYDDGHSACLPEDQVEPLDLDVGDRVFARWKCGAIYHPGQITRKRGEEIHIAYDDGDFEETTISVVRIFRDRQLSPYENQERYRY